MDENQADKECLERLAADIVANKRLAWLVVDRWMKKHGRLMITQEEARQIGPALHLVKEPA